MDALRDLLMKIGAKIVRHSRFITFQIVAVRLACCLFDRNPSSIATLGPLPPA